MEQLRIVGPTIEPVMNSQNARNVKFRVGTYDIHDDKSLNYQMNRWIADLDESGLEDMRTVAPRIKNYEDWKREFVSLAQKSFAEGKKLKSAYYYRAAEFFTFSGDPDKKGLREKFLKLVRESHGMDDAKHYLIPYANGDEKGFLSAYRITPESPQSTIVLFGGFDSYIEEFFSLMEYISERGYDIVCFDGPGQGSALEDYGLHMTPEWEKPVGAILDYFKLDDVTLIGISLGGCLVLRASAFESRVKRAVAFDTLYNFRDTNLNTMDDFSRIMLKIALKIGAARLINALSIRKSRHNVIVEWGMKQGMHVTGAKTPFEYFKLIEKLRTSDISGLIRQDVLLLAGSEDHLVPVSQFYHQIQALTVIRSLTARLFTAEEHGEGHCQVGNFALALDVIIDWISSMEKRDLQSYHNNQEK